MKKKIASQINSFYAGAVMIGKIRGLRGVAEEAFKEALLAADPEEAVHRHFRLRAGVLQVGDIDYFLSRFKRIFLIGAGKASVRMAEAVERKLGDKVDGGLVITSRGQHHRLHRVLVREAGHPFPDQDGVRATEELLELVDPLGDQDLVICVLSGGGSALLAAPVEGMDVSDLQRTNKLLLQSGMSIHQVNVIRKHLSKVKGGRLAGRIHPATVITLILSDVIGDQVEVIASGPTAPDSSRFSDAVDLARRFELLDNLPEPAREHLLRGERGSETETPKPGDQVFRKVHHQIVGSNRISLIATEKKAHRMGMYTMLLSSSVSGESREIGRFYAALAREIRNFHKPAKPPACLIAGGETTVTVTGDGSGGRCQELALSVAMGIQDVPGVVFMAAGTDGIDGPTDAAGAFVDSSTVERARALDISADDRLRKNDTYSLFKELGDLVLTGPSGTNVMDIHLLLIG